MRMEAQRKHMVIPWEKKSYVSGNVGDENNIHWGGQIFIFLINFPEIFSFLL